MKLKIAVECLSQAFIVRSVVKESIKTHGVCLTQEAVGPICLVRDVECEVVLLGRQVAMLELQALIHCPLIQLLVVLEFGFVVGRCLALEVHKWGVVRNVTVLWLLRHVSVSKDVENFLIMLLHVLNLLLSVVLEILVGAALARLIRSVLLIAHSDNFLNSLLHDSALN